ncbi:MAG: cation transporter, partial [Candidatus Marinimicrobia bacterium]|nr:cation transporter [Candidatus Neomarinimicrobiota bacterium]
MRNTSLTVLAAVGASLCCTGPFFFAAVGATSLAGFTVLEPLRPFLSLLATGLIGAAFWRSYRPATAAACCSIEEKTKLSRQRVSLWLTSAVVAVLLAFPYISDSSGFAAGGIPQRSATSSIQVSTWKIEGMTCASCVSRVENKLRDLEGVMDVKVNLANERATVEYLDSRTGIEDFRSALKDIGYKVSLEEVGETSSRDREEERHQRETSVLAWKLGFSALLSFLIFLFGMFPDLHSMSAAQNRFALFLLATPVQFWAGWQFYKGTWTGLRHGYTDMNTLIAVGTSAAYFYSVFAVFFPETVQALDKEVPVY